MDRNSTIGLVLIFILITAWFYVTTPSAEEIERQQQEQARIDSLNALNNDTNAEESSPSITAADAEPQLDASNWGSFAPDTALNAVEEHRFTVEGPKYAIEFTTKGGGPAKINFKEYNNWTGTPVQLLTDTTKSAYSLGFISNENYNIETSALVFSTPQTADYYTLESGQTKDISFNYHIDESRQLVYTYHLNADSYEIDLDVQLVGMQQTIIGNKVDFGWNTRLGFTEKDHKQENMLNSAYAYSGGELEQLHLSDKGKEQTNLTGEVDWVSTRTKFFTQIIDPQNPTDGAILTGTSTDDHDEAIAEQHYSAIVSSRVPEDGKLSYSLYIGPLSYDIIKDFNEHAFDMVNVGYSWTRWFSDPLVRFAIIPYFNFATQFISFGLAIIIFAFLVKLVLTPLTLKSFKSMAAMRELQPKMQELQKKYEKNPQKQQQEVMKLYRKEKVNPLGGCLPMLLQFPILITLWRFFQNTIQVRQQEFLWANDLSAPDHIIHLPFSLPILGDGIGGFVILMSIAMMVQSKVSGGASGGASANPQMKGMQYMLPVMMFFFFNNMAAGLSLYYLIFNVLSILQQMYINKGVHAQKVAEAKVVGSKGRK